MKYESPAGLVLEIMQEMNIGPEGYAVERENEDMIVLLHYKTHLEVTIRKGVKREWLSTKKPCYP